MLDALYNYFYDLLNMHQFDMTIFEYSIGGVDLNFVDYLALLLSHISLIVIIILCCLFIYRLIRLVGRLFTGGAL